MSRWVAVGQGGEHIATLGRYEPSPEEMESISAAMARSGVSGWVVRMEGVYYGRRKLTFDNRQPINNPTATWESAVVKFLEHRKERNRT